MILGSVGHSAPPSSYPPAQYTHGPYYPPQAPYPPQGNPYCPPQAHYPPQSNPYYPPRGPAVPLDNGVLTHSLFLTFLSLLFIFGVSYAVVYGFCDSLYLLGKEKRNEGEGTEYLGSWRDCTIMFLFAIAFLVFSMCSFFFDLTLDVLVKSGTGSLLTLMFIIQTITTTLILTVFLWFASYYPKRLILNAGAITLLMFFSMVIASSFLSLETVITMGNIAKILGIFLFVLLVINLVLWLTGVGWQQGNLRDPLEILISAVSVIVSLFSIIVTTKELQAVPLEKESLALYGACKFQKDFISIYMRVLPELLRHHKAKDRATSNPQKDYSDFASPGAPGASRV